MTPEERQQSLLQGIDLLCKQYGYNIGAIVVPKQYGPMLQVEAAVTLVPIENWQPPVPPDYPPAAPKGKPTRREIKKKNRGQDNDRPTHSEHDTTPSA